MPHPDQQDAVENDPSDRRNARNALLGLGALLLILMVVGLFQMMDRPAHNPEKPIGQPDIRLGRSMTLGKP